jgi:hypothetical protein
MPDMLNSVRNMAVDTIERRTVTVTAVWGYSRLFGEFRELLHYPDDTVYSMPSKHGSSSPVRHD